MKRALHLVLSFALLFCATTTYAQRQNDYNVLTDVKTKGLKGNGVPEVNVMEMRGATVIYMVDEYHYPYDISDNGQHVVIQGFGEYSSYYWSEVSGLVPMEGVGFAVTDDGVIAGYFTDGATGANVAGMWFPDMQEWTFLGMNPEAPEIQDLDYNQVWAMTNDGSQLAVLQINPDWTTASYIWTAEDGYVRLDHADSQSSRPNAINHDGSVVAGHGVVDMGWTPCFWADGEYHDLSNNQYFGEALGVSDNGNYVVGYLEGMTGEAFVYDVVNDIFVAYPNPNGEGTMSASCVNNDGEAFGYTATGFPPMAASRRAFAIANGAYMTFNEYLAMKGFSEAADWTFYSINSVTADGKTFTGAANIDGTDYSIVLRLEEESGCGAPTNLTFTIDEVNYDDVVLNWEAPADPVDVTYEIYTGYTATEPLVTGISETTYTFADLTPGTYSYIVKANWGGECLSAGSNLVNPVVNACPTSEMCDITIEMRDEYGDGWNDAYIQIKGSYGNVLYNVELENGTSETVDLPLCSDVLTFTWVPGAWDAEIGFTIYKDGEELYNIETVENPLGTFLEYELVCVDNVAEIETEINVSILPNPANNYFNVKAENISSIEVFNAVGQTVEVINTNADEVQVNTSAMENGIYFVKIVTTDADVTVKKVIISK